MSQWNVYHSNDFLWSNIVGCMQVVWGKGGNVEHHINIHKAGGFPHNEVGYRISLRLKGVMYIKYLPSIRNTFYRKKILNETLFICIST